ncbi:MAG: SprT family zinc-dependent metalloprotease [Betaproteobacteria bacterium]
MRMFFKLKKAPVALPEESERSIALAGHRVAYKLVRRRGRRGVGLKIDGTGMTVAASLTTPIGSIEDLIGKNSDWVLKKLNEWSHRRIQPQRWQTGATVYFMGESLTLMIDAGATRINVEQSMGHLFVRLPRAEPSAIEKAAQAWYKRQALPHLAQRAFFYARLHGLTPPRVFLSSANSRWGSCNAQREVRFSWRLIKARPALIDYVVCHELAHLRHMDHSPAFWREVERMCPDYRALKAELDASDHKFRAF